MAGTAAYWFDWLMKVRGGHLGREEFGQAIWREYGPSQFTNHVIELKLLRQKETVHEYDAQFLKISKRVQGINENCLVSQYMGG